MLTKPGQFVISVFIGASWVIGSGCARKPDDNLLAQSIQTQLQKDTAINGQITAQSANGVVTLSGTVPSDAARALAAREAADTPGVKEIVNNLSVNPAASQPADSAAAQPPAQPAPDQPPAQPAPDQSAAPPQSPGAPASPAAPAPPPAPAPVAETIPAGTTISVRLIDSLDSSRNRAGDTFHATLAAPIRVNGEVVAPTGARVRGRVVDAAAAGRFTGHSELGLELTRLTLQGQVYSLATRDLTRSTKGRGKGTAETVGGGAAFGAIIGAIAGGGKGAAIGSLAGGGAGGVFRGAHKGAAVVYPSESVLTFRLAAPVTVTAMPGEQPAQ